DVAGLARRLARRLAGAVVAELAVRAGHARARIGLAHRRRAHADLAGRAALRLARCVGAHALLADGPRRARDLGAGIDADELTGPGVELAELAGRAVELLALVGHAQVGLGVADEPARAGELAARAGQHAGAHVALEARRAVAVHVDHAGAVGGDAVALVGHG